VFILFRRKVDESESAFLLEALDVKTRSVHDLASFNAYYKAATNIQRFSWQCAGDNFVIAQLGSYDGIVLKAFAR
jgi:hypothetical protein